MSPLVTQLTWTHCLILISIKDIDEIYYYALQLKIELFQRENWKKSLRMKNIIDYQMRQKVKFIMKGN